MYQFLLIWVFIFVGGGCPLGEKVYLLTTDGDPVIEEE